MEATKLSIVIDDFAHDLYQYLFPRRLDIIYSSTIRIRSNLPSLFHPHIGMAVLRESQRSQKHFTTYFKDKYPVFLKDNFSFFAFCAEYGQNLCRSEKDVLKATITVASMVLELSTFCHLNGYHRFIFYAGLCFAEMFKHFIKSDFFPKFNWIDLLNYSFDDAKFYLEGKYEIFLPGGRIEMRTGWLKQLDAASVMPKRSVIGNDGSQSQVPPNATEISASKNESSRLESHKEKNIDDKSGGVETEENKDLTQGISIHQIPNKFGKDTLAVKITIKKPVKSVKTECSILDKFKDMIREEGPTELLGFLESKRSAGKLLSHDAFVGIMRDAVENSKERFKNEHILELAKLMLSGNADMVNVFIEATRYVIYTNTIKSMEMDGNFPKLDDLARVPPLLERHPESITVPPSKGKSPKSLGAIPKTTVSKIKPTKIDGELLRDFKSVISVNGDAVGSEICKIIECPANEAILSDSVFKCVVALTVQFPTQRWGNEWLLSFVQTIVLDSENQSNVAASKASLQTLEVQTKLSLEESLQAKKDCYNELYKLNNPEASSDFTSKQSRIIEVTSDSGVRNQSTSSDEFAPKDSNISTLESVPDESEDKKSAFINIVDLKKPIPFEKIVPGKATKAAQSHLDTKDESETDPKRSEESPLTKSKKKRNRRKKRSTNECGETSSPQASTDPLQERLAEEHEIGLEYQQKHRVWNENEMAAIAQSVAQSGLAKKCSLALQSFALDMKSLLQASRRYKTFDPMGRELAEREIKSMLRNYSEKDAAVEETAGPSSDNSAFEARKILEEETGHILDETFIALRDEMCERMPFPREISNWFIEKSVFNDDFLLALWENDYITDDMRDEVRLFRLDYVIDREVEEKMNARLAGTSLKDPATVPEVSSPNDSRKKSKKKKSKKNK